MPSSKHRIATNDAIDTGLGVAPEAIEVTATLTVSQID